MWSSDSMCVANMLVLVVAVAAAVNAASDLPASFTKCRAKDAGLNECLKKAVPEALRLMKAGVPELGVEALEPLYIPAVDIDSGAGPVRIQQSYRHVNLHGLTASHLNTYKADLAHYRLRTDSFTPVMQFIGDYVMKGNVLLLPIQGKGIANVTLVNLVVKHDLIGEPVEKNGVRYMHIKEYRVLFKPGKVHMHFTNLFNGDKLLGDQMNRFLNEHADLVFAELRAAYENAFGKVFKKVTNHIFDSVPFTTIFPQD